MNRTPSSWDHFLEHAALSDIGLRRANNQDSMAVVPAGSREKFRRRGHLFIVADGMGAHAAGELASKLATDAVPLAYHKLKDLPPPEALRTAVLDANSQIYSRGQASDDFKGMGTTICAMALLPQGALLGHVGDSRVYRLRGGRLEQLTFDHSLVWEMRAAGQIPDDDTPSFIPKNVITRSLGPNAEVQVDVEGPFPLQVGDAFLLCSDGLSGPVEDHEIGKIVACMPPEEAVRSLVDLANLRGGPDNITVIVVRVTGDPESSGGESAEAEARPARPVHPAVLGTGGLCLVAALVLGAMGSWLLAAAGLIGAGIAGAIALVQRYGSDGGDGGFHSRPLGRGPYKACDCTPDAPFAQQLAGLAGELRQAAVAGDWNVDWSRFNARNEAGGAAVTAGDFGRAVREYCHAISFMMSELKAQRSRKRAGDSAIDMA